MAKTPTPEHFPTSRQRSVKGTRHLAREKALQILAATEDGETSWDVVFPHIFNRQFTFDPDEPTSGSSRILKPDEVFELEADVPIQWSQEDVDYAVHVIRTARDKKDHSQAMIDRHAKNWDIERIAMIDRILMHMAITELTACPDIPVKVTINEVIELAKQYSTDKSGTFINGILDAIVVELREKNEIHKTGRGLVE